MDPKSGTKSKRRRNHNKLDANFLPSNGNESRYSPETKIYDPIPLSSHTTDDDESHSDDEDVLANYALKKSAPGPESGIPFSNAGSSPALSHSRDRDHDHDASNLTKFPITFHRITANGAAVDDEELRDREQYHYDNGHDHGTRNQLAAAAEESTDVDADDEDEHDRKHHSHRHHHRDRGQSQNSKKKSCLKNGSCNANGSVQLYGGGGGGTTGPPRPLDLGLGASTSSSGGSLITTRESASMTPISGLDGLGLEASSHLLIVTEQLEGIQRTQDSILNQLKNDMEVLQLDNSKLKRENDALRARTYEMNGIIDNLTIDLDRIKKRIKEEGQEIAGRQQKQPSPPRDNGSPSVEQKDSCPLSTPSLVKLANKYGIALPSRASSVETDVSNGHENRVPVHGSPAVLRVDTPMEVVIGKDGSLKPEQAPKKSRTKSKPEHESRYGHEKPLSPDHERGRERNSNNNSSGKKREHKSKSKTTDHRPPTTADTDAELTDLDEPSNHQLRGTRSQERTHTRTKSSRPSEKEKTAPATSDRRSKNGKGYDESSRRSSRTDMRDGRGRDRDRDRYRDIDTDKDRNSAPSTSDYFKVRKTPQLKNESKKFGSGCFEWLGAGKRRREKAEKASERARARARSESKAQASGVRKEVSRDSMKKRTSKANPKSFPVVTLTESTSSITTTIRDGKERSLRGDNSKQVVVTVAVSDDERTDATTGSDGGSSDSEDEEHHGSKKR